jgi:predicted O-methyltransferase YrrM
MTVFEDTTLKAVGPLPLKEDEIDLFWRKLAGEAPKSVLEVCQNAGQLSLSLAALLQDQGYGVLTTFHGQTASGGKAFQRILTTFGLQDRIAMLPAGRSYTWALQRLISQSPRPLFDVCILNGSKKWDSITTTILLADMLLRKGGLMVLLDTGWSMNASPYFRERTELTQKYAEDELKSKPVKLVEELVAPHLGYQAIKLRDNTSFAVLRKS